MAFDIRYWSQISASLNNTHSVGPGGVQGDRGAPNIFSYWAKTDTSVQVATEDYFLPVVNSLKIGDLIYVVATDGTVNLTVTDLNYSLSAKFITVTPSNLMNGVTNNTGGRLNDIPIFADNTGQVIKDSNVGFVNVGALPTHFERAEKLGTEPPDALVLLQLSGIDSIGFSHGVGSLFVSGLQAIQFIDNDFGADHQICALITGELPGSSTSPSALLELKSTTGVFLPTRLTSAQIDALTSPQDGSQCYNSTLQRMVFKENGVWVAPTLADGTVKSLSPGTGISMSPNPITTTGTISNTGVLSVGSSSSIASSGGQTPTLALTNTGVAAGTYVYVASLETDAQGRILNIASGTAPVSGVLSVSGSAGRVTSTGGANPVIDLASTTGLAGTYAYPRSVTVDNYRRVTAIVEGSAPTPGNLTAKYIIQESDSTLPNAQSLGSLMSGLLFNTVDAGRGVLRMAIEGVDYASVASVAAAQTTANAAFSLATLANTTAAGADAAAAAASAQASTAQTTANLAFGLATSLALASYITKSSVGLLPNSQSLSTLATGVLKTNRSGTPPDLVGTLTLASAGVDFAGPAVKYIVQQNSDGALLAQSLGDLTTGLLKNTVTGSPPTAIGVLSRAVPDVDYATPASVAAIMTAPFILQSTTTGFTGAQVLSGMGTGLLKNTGGTGVLTVASPGTDYYAPNFPTVIQDGHGTSTENLAVGKDAGIVWTGTSNTVFGIRGMQSFVTGSGNTGFGLEVGGTTTSATNCTWFGYLARNIANGLTNACAVGAGAQVGVSNAVSLGYQCFVGINNSSPAYALDIKSGGGGPDALIRLQTASIPSAPGSANDGIYSVNSGRPKFTSGNTMWQGTLPTIKSGGSNATVGFDYLSGTTPVVVNTTSVNIDSLIFVFRNNRGGVVDLSSSGQIAGGYINPGVSFSFASTDEGDDCCVNWLIINP